MKGFGDACPSRSPLLSGIFRLILRGGACLLLAPALQALPEPVTHPSVPRPDLKDDGAGMREALRQRAVAYLLRYREDDLGQAVRLFNQILKSGNDFAPAYGGLAEARSLRYLWGWEPELGRLKQAVQQGQKGVELGPDLADTHLGLGIALMASDRYTPALAELDRAVSLDPESFRAHLYRGMLLRGLRRTEELAEEATRILQLDSSSAVAYSLLGDYYQDLRSFQLSRESYLAAALLDQRLVWPRLGLAAAYQKGMDYTAARKTYASTENDFPGELSRCRIMQASLMVATQYYDEALRIYEGIPEKESLSPPLMRRLMQAGRGYALEKMGNIEKAEFFWTQLVEEFPENYDGAVRDREVVSQGYEGLARYYDGRGDKDRSRDILEKGCRQEGMAFSLYRALAERRRTAGDIPGALFILDKGVKGAPRDLDLLAATEASLSMVRAMGAGKTGPEARRNAMFLLDEVEARLALNPGTSYVPHLDLARCEALLGREALVIPHLRDAVERGFTSVASLAGDSDFKLLAGNPEFQALTTTP